MLVMKSYAYHVFDNSRKYTNLQTCPIIVIWCVCSTLFRQCM